jgi:phage shock protein B
MPEEFIAILAIVSIFIALPWIILHYVSKWKSQTTLTTEDENLLDELYDLARRLEDRVMTVERIIQAENPNWRALGHDPVETALEDRSERLYEASERTNRPARRN